MAAKKKSDDVPPIPVAPDASPEAVTPAAPAAPEAPAVPEIPMAPESFGAPSKTDAPQVAAGPPPAPAAVTPESEPRPNPYAAPVAPYGTPAAPPYGAPAQPNPYAVTQNYDYTTGTYVTTPVQPQGLSIASMVTGIVAVLLTFASFGFIPGVVAVVLGHLAQKRQPQAKAMWITGLITGYIAAGLGILTGLFWLAIILIIPGAAMWGDFS